MKIGNNDVLKIYFGDNEISKIYLGDNVIYEGGSSPTPTEDIYMNGRAMVIKAGTEMELYTDTDTSTYTLPEDITIADLLSQQSGTLTNSDNYTYYPEFEIIDYSGTTIPTTTKVSSVDITIDGTTYSASPSYTDWKTLWETYVIPNLFANTTISTNRAGLSTSENAHYYTIKVSGLAPNQKFSVPDSYMFNFTTNDSGSSTRFKTRMIFHSVADVTDTTKWLFDSGLVSVKRWLTPWSSQPYISSDSNGEFYLTFLIPGGQTEQSSYSIYQFSGYMRGIKELYNTNLGVDLMVPYWSGTGPKTVQISFRELDGYMDSSYKYLINVQKDGSAVITPNPDYQPT